MRQKDNPLIAERYNSKKWQKVRKLKKQTAHALCERCFAKGKYVPGVIVHHKEYITEKNYMDDNVFLNLDNLELLCAKCHLEEHGVGEQDYYFDEKGNLCQKY